MTRCIRNSVGEVHILMTDPVPSVFDSLQSARDYAASQSIDPAAVIGPLNVWHTEPPKEIAQWRRLRASEPKPDCSKCYRLWVETDYPLAEITRRVHPMDARTWDHLQACVECRATWQYIPATRPSEGDNR